MPTSGEAATADPLADAEAEPEAEAEALAEAEADAEAEAEAAVPGTFGRSTAGFTVSGGGAIDLSTEPAPGTTPGAGGFGSSRRLQAAGTTTSARPTSNGRAKEACIRAS
ncbi:MAG: hypothetical protein IPJ34_22325 [Myxococcales bacterium]|nr:hypothetical protein [Myxococcales bacterium]